MSLANLVKVFFFFAIVFSSCDSHSKVTWTIDLRMMGRIFYYCASYCWWLRIPALTLQERKLQKVSKANCWSHLDLIKLFQYVYDLLLLAGRIKGGSHEELENIFMITNKCHWPNWLFSPFSSLPQGQGFNHWP
jgi:hypothetical protein